jgi:hypothetical protein
MRVRRASTALARKTSGWAGWTSKPMGLIRARRIAHTIVLGSATANGVRARTVAESWVRAHV